MPAPTFCPEDIANIMASCWRQDHTERPIFSQITQSLCRTSLLQTVFHGNGEQAGKDEEGSEERKTIYSSIISNDSMYSQYTDIKDKNLSYMKMEAQKMSSDSVNVKHIVAEKHETEVIESEHLKKDNVHSQYCHYLSLKTTNSDAQSQDGSESGAFTDTENTSSMANTVESLIPIEDNEIGRRQIGRLQSLNEVEEDII